MAENRQLRPLLLGARESVFAVVDGAQFHDLPMTLFDGGFIHRSLYLDHGNGTADQLRTAPQVVRLDYDARTMSAEKGTGKQLVDENILDRFLTLVGERPAVVFWQCTAGYEALYRHLRGINKVLFPKQAYLGRNVEVPASGFEMVVFRHADANVMAQVSSSLEWDGLSRLLGPAGALLLLPDEDWGAKPMRVQRHDEMPLPQSGPMRIELAEIKAMDSRRFDWLTRRTIKYLREYTSALLEKKSDQAITGDVRKWLREAQVAGVTQESAFRKWCYLQVLHGGRLQQSDTMQAVSKERGSAISPDERVGQMMKYMIKEAEKA